MGAYPALGLPGGSPFYSTFVEAKIVGLSLVFSDIKIMKTFSLIGIFFFGLSIGCFGQNVENGTPSGTLPESKPPVETGIASWYGPGFEGKPTASGELFDPTALTAAHPTLPFGTLVRITNKNNGKQVIVRINDRGPFVANRCIDLSQAAAERLDMGQTGTIPVTLEILPSSNTAKTGGPAALAEIPPVASAAPVKAPAAPTALEALPATAVPAKASVEVPPEERPGADASASTDSSKTKASPAVAAGAKGKFYRIQVGSFKLSRNAVDAINRIKTAGLEPAYERFQDLYRVVVVQVPQLNLEAVKAQLGSAGFTNLLIREEVVLP